MVGMKKHFVLYLLFFLLLGMSEKSTAQDWANLAKYENENTVLTPKKPGEKRIVLIGDSITEFWLQIHPEFFAGKSYIDR